MVLPKNGRQQNALVAALVVRYKLPPRYLLLLTILSDSLGDDADLKRHDDDGDVLKAGVWLGLLLRR